MLCYMLCCSVRMYVGHVLTCRSLLLLSVPAIVVAFVTACIALQCEFAAVAALRSVLRRRNGERARANAAATATARATSLLLLLRVLVAVVVLLLP